MEHDPKKVTSSRLDWVLTIRYGSGRLPKLLTALEPTMHLPDIQAIDRHFLRAHGIEGLIWDLDGTLTSHGASDIHPRVRATARRLLEHVGLRHVVLSNAPPDRLRPLSAELPGVPFVKGYVSGRNVTFRTFLSGEESWTSDRNRRARALRKPDPRLLEFAIRQVGVTRRDHIAVVGDQYLTDIAPANLAGLISLKVPTLEPASFPLPVRALQIAERGLHAWVTTATRWVRRSPGS